MEKKCINFFFIALSCCQWSNIHEENLASKIYFLSGCKSSMMSQGEQQLQKLNESDMLLQQPSRSGSGTLTPSKIATAKELSKGCRVANLKE